MLTRYDTSQKTFHDNPSYAGFFRMVTNYEKHGHRLGHVFTIHCDARDYEKLRNEPITAQHLDASVQLHFMHFNMK